LKINNFRGFDSLEIDGLSKINLFVGKNNSGKTSILEALFLLSGMVYTDLPSVINSFRGFDSETESLKYLFHNFSYKNKPAIYGKFSDSEERQLELAPIFQTKQNLALTSTPQINGIKFLFSLKNSLQKDTETFSLIYGKEGPSLNFEASGGIYKFFNAAFIHANKSEVGMFAKISDMIIRKEDDAILKILQTAFGDSIVGIRIAADNIYFDIKGLDQLVPINIMGEGIKSFLNIVTAVLGKLLLTIESGSEWLKINPTVINSNAFVCIDEIENGLHYSAHKNLWKALLSFVSQNDTQLFIATHNIETITSLKGVLEEDFTSMQNDVAVFDIEKTKKAGYMAYRYSYKGFRGALENEIEIRD
jgi:AAA15 family ATPase/GTPase